MFLGQRLATDYCAVCAVGMFLSLQGRPHSRAQAHRLFGTRRRGWSLPVEADVTDALERVLGPRAVRHRRVRTSTAAAFERALRLACGDGPALVTALCRLVGDERIRCMHAFLAIDVDDQGARLLDSLAPRPAAGERWNAKLVFDCERGDLLKTVGTPWQLDLSGPISLFTVTQA